MPLAVGFVAPLGILVFGSPAVLLVGGVSVLLARRPAVRDAAFGAPTGAGLVLLFVAYQNLQGPGIYVLAHRHGNWMRPTPQPLALASSRYNGPANGSDVATALGVSPGHLR